MMSDKAGQHDDTCECPECKLSRKRAHHAAYMREYSRKRKEADPEYKKKLSARAVENLQKRMAADPEFAAYIRERDRKRMQERRDLHPEAQRQSNVRYYAKNRERMQERARQYRQENPEVARQSYKKSYRKKREQADPTWVQAQRDRAHKHYHENREHHAEVSKAWKERNQDRVRGYHVVKNANRRAREKAAGGSWTWDQFGRLCAAMGNRCFYCGNVPDKLTPDHVVPLARGGSNFITNIVPACLPCNVRKSTMTADEFFDRIEEEQRRQ